MEKQKAIAKAKEMEQAALAGQRPADMSDSELTMTITIFDIIAGQISAEMQYRERMRGAKV